MVTKKHPFLEDPDLAKLFMEFVSSFPDRVKELEKASHSGDSSQLVRLLHTLAGAAGTYQFLEMSELAAKLELNPESSGVKRLQEMLQNAYREFISDVG